MKLKYDLSGLNKGQKEAVETTEQPVLIIAGPGSGKSKTLVDRIIYLITEKYVSVENIMLSTFTEKASKELITRVTNKLTEMDIRININEMYIGTLHSIFLRILEENREFTRLKRNYRLLDQFDQQYHIFQNINRFLKIDNIDTLIGLKMAQWRKANLLMGLINKVSEEYLDIDSLLNSGDITIKALAEVYLLFQKLLEEENAIDFSAIQTETYKLLENNPEVLEKLQDKLQYIMVDEYQDTNTIQEMILLKLADKYKRICVVGDDDQGLYRFRGASVRNILEFPQNFDKDECKKIYLSTNYRSHPKIIKFFNAWMNELDWQKDGTTFRFEKNIQAREDKEFIDNPSVIKVTGKHGQDNWHEEVYEFLKSLKDSGKLKDFNQVAFLFTSVRNEKVIDLANYLEEKGIRVFSPRSKMYFDREEIRLIIGALIFLFPQFVNDMLPEIYSEVLKKYYQGCFDFFFEKLREDKETNKPLIKWCKNKALTHERLENNTDWAFSNLFYELLQFPLFSQYINIDLNKPSYDLRPSYNLAMFSQLLNKMEYLHNILLFRPKQIEWDLKHLFVQFLGFLYDGGIDEYEDFDEYAPSGCVSFLTIHQSKGLEFPIVFVDSLNSVPRKRYGELDQILQDNFYRKKPFEPIDKMKSFDYWRLFYVAFSRSQNLLVLTGQEKTSGSWQLPNKYIKKLYNKCVYWRDERVDLSKLELEEMKELNIKKQYSFTSNILLWENCALQYKFFKELDFVPVRKSPIIFGVLVHQTIEDIHKAVLRKEEHKITKENIKDWFNENYTSITKSNRVYLVDHVKNQALEHVLAYYKRFKGKWDRIREAEVDVSLVKDKYILQGTIDLIKGKNDTVEIIDFKSEKKIDVNSKKDRDKLERYRRQLEVYAHIVEERTKHKVSKMQLYYTSELSGVPEITFKRTQESIDKTIEAFDEIVRKIESKDYSMEERPELKVCKNCDMQSYCDRCFGKNE